jgi:sigma-B regulation protein RsbU (phosphoserine phosphatase)
VFTTLSIILLDNKNMVLKYSGAGDLPIIYKKKTDSNSLKIHAEGLLLGFVEDSDYQDSKINMNPDDYVILNSDGIIEATNQNKEQFGATRLMNLMNNFNGEGSLLETIKNSVSDFSQSHFEDDISLVTIKSVK